MRNEVLTSTIVTAAPSICSDLSQGVIALHHMAAVQEEQTKLNNRFWTMFLHTRGH
jgi:hypothetical protein